MRRPYDLYVERTPHGHVVLHSTSAIESRGKGPIEVHGKRIGKKRMSVTQRIYRANGSHLDVQIPGSLRFKFIPGQGGYWKFADAARFQLWSLDRNGKRKRLVQRGPKVYYCLRDLFRTSPSRRSPRQRVYPGCNQNPNKRRVTLGTSAGWSDVYPADYYEQYINVSGLRGCFAFVLVVQSLPFLAAVAMSLLEGSRLNSFAYWQSLETACGERLLVLRPDVRGRGTMISWPDDPARLIDAGEAAVERALGTIRSWLGAEPALRAGLLD